MNSIIVENINGQESQVDAFQKLFENRNIFLYDYVDVATNVVADLLYLDSVSNEKITLFINSEGGYVKDILMIYDIIKTIKSPLQTICAGACLHEPILLLALGQKGNRFCTKNAILAISQANPDGFYPSDLNDIKINYDEMKKNNDRYMKALGDCLECDLGEMSKYLDRRQFLTAEAAVDYKIIDKVINYSNEKNIQSKPSKPKPSKSKK
jgi:ATP-dependent Clp protease protease subunit